MEPVKNIVQLRQLLAERFPNVHRWVEGGEPPQSRCATGVRQLDQLLEGGLLKGALTELVSAPNGSGSALVLRGIVRHASANGQLVALIDGRDSFDACAVEQHTLNRLLWVRCSDASQALKAVDLVLRDGNLRLVLLDLQLNPPEQLRKIPGTTWYRLQRIVEHHGTVLVVVTPRAMVSSVDERISIDGRFSLDALNRTDDELLPQLRFELVRRQTSSAAEFLPLAAAKAG